MICGHAVRFCAWRWGWRPGWGWGFNPILYKDDERDWESAGVALLVGAFVPLKTALTARQNRKDPLARFESEAEQEPPDRPLSFGLPM